jgi:TonB family protein
MRLAVLVEVVTIAMSSRARGDGAVDVVKRAIASEKLTAALADPVQVRGLAFVDPVCQRKLGHSIRLAGEARNLLSTCLLGPGTRVLPGARGGKAQLVVTLHGEEDSATLLYEVTVADGRITEIAGYGAADLPVVLEPERTLARGTAKAGAKTAITVCTGDDGKVTSRRVIDSSGTPAFDTAALATLHDERFEPLELEDHPVASCHLVRVTAT